MFRVLLVSLHDNGTYGHRCVSASLKHAGFSVHNVFFRSNRGYQRARPVSEVELQALANLARRLRPDLVGLNVHSSFGHPLAKTVTARLKACMDVPIIWGGVHPTLVPRYCLEETMADYACIGEAEETIVEVCHKISSGASCEEVPGVMSRRRLTYTRRVPPQDLDQLPFQDVGNDDMYSILSDGSLMEGDPMLRESLLSTKCSRGCPFNCSYCSVGQLRGLCKPGKFYRLRAPDRVVEEIGRLVQANPKCTHIRLWDDTFPYGESWVETFARQYESKVGIPFTVYLNPDTTKQANIAALKAAGLKEVFMGIESASDSTRERVFLRNETRDHIAQADRILSECGVSKVYDFIVDHPWESPTELQDTFDLVMTLRRPFRLNMHSLVLLPGTALACRAIEETALDEDAVLKNIISDTTTCSRKIQWCVGIPPQDDPERAYWVFLVMAAGHPDIPRWITRFLANRQILRRHPGLLTGKVEIGTWQVYDEVPRLLSAIYLRSPALQRFFAGRPRLKEFIKRGLRPLMLTCFLARVCFRFLTRIPWVLLTQTRRRIVGSRPVY